MAAKTTKKPAEKKVKKAKPVITFAPMKYQDFTISQKRSGRFQVVTAEGKNINAAEKAKILVDAKVLKGSFKKEAAAEAPQA